MVFERAAEAGASAIINISSQSVYSQQRTDAATEETPVSLESSYAVGKYAVELILESICRGSNTVFTNLRMASLIGPGFDQRIVNRFVKQALETGTLNVKRNQKKFGFFDVEDAVDRIVAMLGSKKMTWKHVYNLGRDGAYTLIGIAETVKDVVKGETGKQIEIIVTDGDEIGNSELNVRSFEKDFGSVIIIHNGARCSKSSSSFCIFSAVFGTSVASSSCLNTLAVLTRSAVFFSPRCST